VPASAELTPRSFPEHDYAVGREKIREYARAVGETDSLYFDVGVARAAGHADVVAPPMFAVVYAGAGFAAAMRDPELDIDLAMLLHSGQEFEWGELVIAGDHITTQTSLADVSQRVGMRFIVFKTSSRNQRGEDVCEGTWTVVVRQRT
jgi:acyl dehydratase